MVRKALAVIAVLSFASGPLSAGEGPGAPLRLKKTGHNLDVAQTALELDGADVAFDGVGAYKPNLTVAAEGGSSDRRPAAAPGKASVFQAKSPAPPVPSGKEAKAPAKAEAKAQAGDKAKADDKGGGSSLPVVGAAIGGLVGAAIGFAVGGPIGAAAGFLAGALVGALIGYLIDKRKQEQGGK
ncbi:MAG: glycine zipper domain-containing protein [Elusimicrobiota bacterium]